MLSDDELDTLLTGYLDTLLWSSRVYTEEEDEWGERAEDYPVSDAMRESCREDCDGFYGLARRLLASASVKADLAQVGHDFALTRNRHGTGFWDRPELYGGIVNARALTEVAHSFGSVDLYLSAAGELEVQ